MKKGLILCLLLPLAFGQSAARVMTKLTVRLESPAVLAGTFAAEPKTLYRSGEGHCRTEEVPDTAQGIHGLMIINEPDVWMVNRLTKTARHFVDPGPTFICRMPIFIDDQVKTAADTKNPLLELEFGQELEYFKRKNAASQPGPVLRGKPTTVYTFGVGDSQLLLFTTGTPEQPWALVRQFQQMRETFWYNAYEQLPFDPELFAKPTGVQIEEAK